MFWAVKLLFSCMRHGQNRIFTLILHLHVIWPCCRLREGHHRLSCEVKKWQGDSPGIWQGRTHRSGNDIDMHNLWKVRLASVMGFTVTCKQLVGGLECGLAKDLSGTEYPIHHQRWCISLWEAKCGWEMGGLCTCGLDGLRCWCMVQYWLSTVIFKSRKVKIIHITHRRVVTSGHRMKSEGGSCMWHV